MSTSNMSNAPTTAALVYSYQKPALIAWLITCNVSIIFNILIILVILKTMTLRTKSHLIVVSLCIAELIATLAWETSAIQRLVIYVYNLSENISQFACMWQVYPINVAPIAVETFITAISIDRFFAILFPVSYSLISQSKYIFLINSFCWAYSLGLGFLPFHGYDPRKILPFCTYAVAYNDTYYLIKTVQGCVKGGITIVCDTITLLALWRRLRETRKLPPQQRREQRLNLELGTIRTLIVLGVVYLISYGLTGLSGVLLLLLPSAWGIKLAPAVTLLSIFNSISHLLVYLIMSSTFRAAFRKLFWMKNTSMTSTTNKPVKMTTIKSTNGILFLT